jgi:hypothetical protein
MDDVERIVGLARASAYALVSSAGHRMLSGADADRIHAIYVVCGLELLAEIEVYAVLAATGDREALAAINRIRGELRALRDALEDERA